MKRIILISAFAFAGIGAFGQSNSYQAMKETFIGGEDVHAFSVNGFFARAVFSLADEHQFREAITDVKSIKLITVPKLEFKSKGLTVDGFKKLLKADSFQELVFVRDNGSDATFFLQENGRNKDRYFILIEENDEVIRIEMKGSVDMSVLMKMEGERGEKGR